MKARLRFNESILTLAVASEAAPETAAGLFLLHAYNSKRSLAFMERSLFQTPYYQAAIQLADAPPASFDVRDPAGGQLRAAAAASTRPQRATHDDWQGAVHLPRQRTAPQQRGGYFYARIAGPGEAYPFVAGADTLTITPSAASPALRWLRDSGFTPQVWRHRPAATHGKSRTYPRARG
jgi:hypothetical protein